MDKEPRNYTIIYSGYCRVSSDGSITPLDIHESILKYKNYAKYDFLPGVAKSETIEREYNAWWDWYNKNKYLEP